LILYTLNTNLKTKIADNILGVFGFTTRGPLYYTDINGKY